MPRKATPHSGLAIMPGALLRDAVRQVPAMRYAVGVGGIAAVVAIVLMGWKLEPQTAIFGGLIVFVAMVVLVVFAALSRSGPRLLRPLALFLAWTFLSITVAVAILFVSCAFFDRPKTLPCLLQGRCGTTDESDVIVNDGGNNQDREVERAKAVLSDLYGEHFQKLYDSFVSTVRESVTFVQFRDVGRRQLAQVKGGPLHRRLRNQQVMGGFLSITFTAEFDEASTWLEGVTFARTPKGWELYRLDFQPASWSAATGNARVLSESEPSQVLDRIRNGVAIPKSIIGQWIPPSGWRARFASLIEKKGERTCDIELKADGAVLIGHNVLGGCKLRTGAEVDVVGKVMAIEKEKIEITEIRFQPV